MASEDVAAQGAGQVGEGRRSMAISEPFLKWAGGKRKLLPHLLEHVPKLFNVYHEPFFGGGALFFAVRPRVAMISDSNAELMRTYQTVSENVESVISHLRRMPHSEQFYYQLRDEPLPLAPTRAWQAARFIYLNRTCFNGLYRVNKTGKFNVPFGKYKNPTICDIGRLRDCSKVLKRAWISVGDFEFIHFAKGDFAYFDPPYVPVSKTSNFTAYTSAGFGAAEQKRLAKVALRLKRSGVCVLLSNADCPQVRELYSDGFEFESVQVRRCINSDRNGRGPVPELIIW